MPTQLGISPHTSTSTLAHCATLLLRGQLVIVPTETVYGLAADATNDEACKRIFRVKQRPSNNPLIVHCADVQDALRCLDKGREDSEVQKQYNKTTAYHYAQTLLSTYAPGPLTVIAYANTRVCHTARAGGQTLAVRVPAHPLFLKIIRMVQKPLAAPSANISGRPSATNAGMAQDELAHAVSAILDGGACTVGLESTIVDCTQNPPAVVRPGAIRRSDIAATISKLTRTHTQKPVVATTNTTTPAVVPGSAYAHYKPRCSVHALSQAQADKLAEHATTHYAHSMRLCVRARRKDLAHALPWKHYYCYDSWEALATALYAKFVEAEKAQCAAVFVDMPSESEHEALHNRIARAAEPQ